MQTQRTEPAAGAASGQYLTFRLGSELFGLDILKVREIRGWETVRALPDMPAGVKGVLDLRGTAVPIVDVRVRFGNPHPEYEKTTVVIIVTVRTGEGDAELIGMVVDAVSDVLEVSDAELRPPPMDFLQVNRCYLSGLVASEQGMVVLLDVDAMLSQWGTGV